MKKVLILSGLSGSGKSTFARQFCIDNANWLRVNRDDLRRSLLPVSLSEYWQTWSEREKNRIETLVSELQKTAILEGLARNWNVLIDNTNLKQSYFTEFRQMLSDKFDEVEISYQLLDVPVAECIQRDKYRNDLVGEEVIRQQAEQLAVLKKNVTFRPEVLTRPDVFQRHQDASLPRCILVDIDGTVADKGDRSPFAWHRVSEDTPRWPIIRLVQAMRTSGYAIVFFSGRDAVCRPETTAWLSEYFGWAATDFALFMRPKNDNRKDSIVKAELFDQHIAGRYYVEVVVDDRQQVVDMWRRTIGLTCIQVDYGDF
ncbi:AAA family ATPase [Spirosoma utsteinense]|uniref:Kinase n=1 Tax=Spirosoma utsteinense TaxID=2585773 RepID=A0ABR6W186_9BACT|nr:AAA family ATPase [Spirosoma utsteinense]MBC3786490.1 putative kinase [Spirosoma utsteinense]MBC3789866.1 putative kinase [Spirosoma utsteinense]